MKNNKKILVVVPINSNNSEDGVFEYRVVKVEDSKEDIIEKVIETYGDLGSDYMEKYQPNNDVYGIHKDKTLTIISNEFDNDNVLYQKDLDESNLRGIVSCSYPSVTPQDMTAFYTGKKIRKMYNLPDCYIIEYSGWYDSYNMSDDYTQGVCVIQRLSGERLNLCLFESYSEEFEVESMEQIGNDICGVKIYDRGGNGSEDEDTVKYLLYYKDNNGRITLECIKDKKESIQFTAISLRDYSDETGELKFVAETLPENDNSKSEYINIIYNARTKEYK